MADSGVLKTVGRVVHLWGAGGGSEGGRVLACVGEMFHRFQVMSRALSAVFQEDFGENLEGGGLTRGRGGRGEGRPWQRLMHGGAVIPAHTCHIFFACVL